MSDELLPTQSGGSGSKMALLGLLLLLIGGGAIYFLMGNNTPPPKAAAPSTPTEVADAGRPKVVVQSLTSGNLNRPIAPLPPPEVDAGVVATPTDAGTVVAQVTRPRIIYIDEGPCPGQLDKGAVDAVFRSRYTALHDCYARQLRVNGDLQGRVVAQIMVNPSGAVGSVATAGLTGKSPGLRACFENVVNHMHFPAPKGGCAKVHQSFTFSPNN